MFVPGFWIGMETFVAPCNRLGLTVWTLRPAKTGAYGVGVAYLGSSKKFGWTFPINIKIFVKNDNCWDEAGKQCAGHMSSQWIVHCDFFLYIYIFYNCTLWWTDSRWLCRRIRRIALLTTMLLAWRNAAHRATAWTWAWHRRRHLTTKNGHNGRQLELQIVGHDSCIDRDCSIVETCWGAQQCAGQDNWHIFWQWCGQVEGGTNLNLQQNLGHGGRQ